MRIPAYIAVITIASFMLISISNNVIGDTVWSGDDRISFDTSTSNFPEIAIDSNDNVHIVWADDRSGNYEIYYSKLDNLGNKLIEEKRITFAPSYSWFPEVSVDVDDNLHLVWIDYREGRSGIYYTKLDNDGEKLLHDKPLSISNLGIMKPGQINVEMEDNDALLNDVEHDPTIIVDSNDKIHIAWSSITDPNGQQAGNYEIYYSMLNKDGITLMNNIRLTHAQSDSNNPKIEVDSFNNVCLVWDDNRDGNNEIYFTKFSKKETIIQEKRLTNDSSGSSEPTILVDSQDNVFVSWADNRDENTNQKNYEIYYSKINIQGDYLVYEERLTYSLGDSYFPSLSIDSDDALYVAFHDSRNGPATTKEVTQEYYDKIKNNITDRRPNGIDQNPILEKHRLSGENWEIYLIKIENNRFSDEIRVTDAQANSYAPVIAIDSKNEIRIIWYDERDSNEEIYFKHTYDDKNLADDNLKENKHGTKTISYVGAIVAGILFVGFIVSNEASKYSTFAFISPLYSIIKKEKILNQETRETIYKTISNKPGISFSGLMNELELKNGVLAHHLRTLERGEYIRSARDGKFKRFYLWGQNVDSLSEPQKQILEMIKEYPSITQSELAIHLNATRQAVNYQVKNLVKADLIRLEKDGRKTRCFDGEAS